MIVDAHTHIWTAVPDHPRPEITVVSPVCDVPLSLLSHYLDDHGVDRAVLVQPLFPGEDNGLVADAAVADPERFAAVCVVDPRVRDAADRLEHWVSERGCRGLRLRPMAPDEEAAFGHPDSDPLWRRAADLNVVVSVLARPEHLPTLAALADRLPDVAIVVDHFAHPRVGSPHESDDMSALLDLAMRPRVLVKVSGCYGFSRDARPYADCGGLWRAVYLTFGPERLIWGSDFPHVLLKTGYSGALEQVEQHLGPLPAAHRAAILGGNATRLYW